VTQERWLPVQRFERYEVSDQGRVRGPRGVLTPRLGAHGLVVAFSKDGGRTRHHYLVHRLVLIAFVGHPHRGQVACHNNAQKLDNRLENLRWGTTRE
jgi:hypothetical protein